MGTTPNTESSRPVRVRDNHRKLDYWVAVNVAGYEWRVWTNWEPRRRFLMKPKSQYWDKTEPAIKGDVTMKEGGRNPGPPVFTENDRECNLAVKRLPKRYRQIYLSKLREHVRKDAKKLDDINIRDEETLDWLTTTAWPIQKCKALKDSYKEIKAQREVTRKAVVVATMEKMDAKCNGANRTIDLD